MNEVDISEHELLQKYPEVLHTLLKDHTRTAYEAEKAHKAKRKVSGVVQRNIIWATNNYQESFGSGFGEQDEITEERITGKFRTLVRPRAVKEKDVQRQRSKDMAEVFTPCWVCNAQNNLVDEAWFGRAGVFNSEVVDPSGVNDWIPTAGPILFDEEPSKTSTKSWQDYVRDVRLEITCGEAPYLVSRYDTVDGRPIEDVNRRVGLLDRKLRVVTENTKKRADWLKWAKEAVKSIYGFEWQGDNLLLAREAVLFTVIDHCRARSAKAPELEASELKEFAEIISWNLWQMDGLRMVLPYSCDNAEGNVAVQLDLFASAEPVKQRCLACEKGLRTGHIGIKCLIRDWTKKGDAQKIVFEKLIKAN